MTHTKRAALARASAGTLGAAALVALAAGCEGASRVTAPGQDLVVVHGVLNPSLATQSVIVERLQSGRQVIDTVAFDPAAPVTTGYGTPLPGARVVVYDARGDSAVAAEERSSGASTGVYRFAAPGGGAVVPGARYTLRVLAPDGTVVTGATTVPNAAPGAIASGAGGADTAPFDRGGVLSLAWAAAPGAARYLVRVDHPFTPYVALVTDTAAAIAGTLVGFETGPVFLPGFAQTVTVAAVDSNLFDYVRPIADQYVNSRSHLSGGVGVFGSVALLARRPLAVTAAARDALDGAYALDTVAQTGAAPAGAAPAGFTLTVYTAAGDVKFGSGRTTGEPAGTAPRGVIGSVRRVDGTDSVRLAVLTGWSGRDTAAVLVGRRDGATFRLVARPVGRVAAGVPVTYRKVGGP